MERASAQFEIDGVRGHPENQADYAPSKRASRQSHVSDRIGPSAISSLLKISGRYFPFDVSTGALGRGLVPLRSLIALDQYDRQRNGR